MKKWRQTIRKIHLWIALALFIPFTLSGLTGSVMVFKNEILSRFEEKNPEFPSDYHPHFAVQIIEAAQKSVPENYSPQLYKAATELGKPAMIRFSSSDKSAKPKTIFVDPISLKISKKNSDDGIFRQIFLLHSTLLIKDFGGKTIIGWFGVALLIMAISGVVIWWPKLSRLKSALTFKFSAQGFNFYRELHRSLGFWTAIFLIIISFSGIYLAFPKPVSSIVTALFPARDLKGENLVIAKNSLPEILTLDKIIEIAQNAAHNENIASINFPAKKTSPYKINLFPENHQKNRPLISVFVNPFDGKVLEILDPKEYSIGETILAWQHALHAGQGLGLFWSIPIFLVGFLPLIFSITGIKMWLMKRGKKITGLYQK